MQCPIMLSSKELKTFLVFKAIHVFLYIYMHIYNIHYIYIKYIL